MRIEVGHEQLRRGIGARAAVVVALDAQAETQVIRAPRLAPQVELDALGVPCPHEPVVDRLVTIETIFAIGAPLQLVRIEWLLCQVAEHGGDSCGIRLSSRSPARTKAGVCGGCGAGARAAT